MPSYTALEAADMALAHHDALQEYELRTRTWETSPVIFENAQWAVTEYGIENVAGPYHYYIPKAEISLGDHWLRHMSGKNWVMMEHFAEAHEHAVFHFSSARRRECCEAKPLARFLPSRTAPDGRGDRCLDCVLAESRRHREDRERRRTSARAPHQAGL